VLVEEFGVAEQVAVWKQIQYARLEVPRGHIKHKAGYMVARIRDRWGRPAGYEPDEEQPWYSEEEYELHFVKPGDLAEGAEEGRGLEVGARGASVVGSNSLWRAP